MTVEPVQRPVEHRVGQCPAADRPVGVGDWWDDGRVERRWQRDNEADARRLVRLSPVSARAHTWAVTLGGPQLAQLLTDVDVASLSDGECVVFAQAVARQQSWTDSMLFDVTARFAEHRPGTAGPRVVRGRGGETHHPGR